MPIRRTTNVSDDLEKELRSSERQKQHDYRSHATAELKVSCRLRLAYKIYKNNIIYQEMALIVLALKLVVRLFFL